MSFLRRTMARSIALISFFALVFCLTGPAVRASVDNPPQVTINPDGSLSVWDDGVRYEFRPDGVVNQISAGGRTLSLSYDTSGEFPRLQAITNSAGVQVAAYTWNSQGERLQTIFQGGRLYHLSYESLPNGNFQVTSTCEGQVVQVSELPVLQTVIQPAPDTGGGDPGGGSGGEPGSDGGTVSAAKVSRVVQFVGGGLLIAGAILLAPELAGVAAVGTALYWAGVGVLAAVTAIGGWLVYSSGLIQGAVGSILQRADELHPAED